jgi:hypothetical protein
MTKKPAPKRPLRLGKATLRTLTGPELAAVNGGGGGILGGSGGTLPPTRG